MNFKYFIALLILFGTMTISVPVSLAVDVQFENEANQLKAINVFKGSEKGLELNREPTRLEGGIMFVKLLGAESEALENNYDHPFTDVPDWGSPFVGYLYRMGYTSGVSETEFGSNDLMQAKSYVTFLLRALDYDDQSGDFSWNNAVEKALTIQMISDEVKSLLDSEVFLRDHLAKLSLDALKTPVKGKNETLARVLVNQGVIAENVASDLGLLDPSSMTQANNQTVSSQNIAIEDVLKTIKGVSNYVDVGDLRYYRPLTKEELSGIPYDGLDEMTTYHNDYTKDLLKASNDSIDWDAWMKIEWGKFDWNDNSHGENLAFDDYWQDYDGNSPATAGSYAKTFGLRLPTEEELKQVFSSFDIGPEEDHGWPAGYYWTGDIDSGDSEVHRFVDTANIMGQAYNDTRDYFVILVEELTEKTDSDQMNKKSPELKTQGQNIYASNEKLPGMQDIPGVANSISVDGVLIYRPLTSKEAEDLIGRQKYDFSIPGKYGYSVEKVDEYTVTLTEEMENYEKINSAIDWTAWFEINWPLYDNDIALISDGPGSEYGGDFSANDGDILNLYYDQNMSITPKYLLDKLLEAYPGGELTAVFGWPTNHSYATSTTDEFGNIYTTSLYIESSRINIGPYDPSYISLTNYNDIDDDKLTESSLQQ